MSSSARLAVALWVRVCFLDDQVVYYAARSPRVPDWRWKVRSRSRRRMQWAAFLVGAYVLGHFLLAAGVPLNRTLRFYKSANKDRFYQSAKKHLIVHSTTEEQARTDTFYLAYASVRLKSPAAAAEIERQMADYKLFRSLAIVFALDLAVNWWLHGRWPRLLLSSLLLALTAVRFGFLLSWTYRITFEYYELLREARAA